MKYWKRLALLSCAISLTACTNTSTPTNVEQNEHSENQVNVSTANAPKVTSLEELKKQTAPEELSISKDEGIAIKASKNLTENLYSLIINASPTQNNVSNSKITPTTRLKIQGASDILCNLDSGVFYFEGTKMFYDIPAEAKFILGNLRETTVHNQTVYNYQEEVKQQQVIDLDGDGIKETVQLIYNGNVLLKIDNQQTTLLEGLDWPKNDKNILIPIMPKFKILDSNQSENKLIVASWLWATNKIGSTAEIYAFAYENHSIKQVFSTKDPYPVNVESKLRDSKYVVLSFPTLNYKQTITLNEEMQEWAKQNFKPDRIYTEQFGTVTNYLFADVDKDQSQELLTQTLTYFPGNPYYLSTTFTLFEMQNDRLEPTWVYTDSGSPERALIEQLFSENIKSTKEVVTELVEHHNQKKEDVLKAIHSLEEKNVIFEKDHQLLIKKMRTLPEEVYTISDLEQGINSTDLSPGNYLKALYETWGRTTSDKESLMETDLNQDGKKEWVFTFNPPPKEPNEVYIYGEVGIVYQKDNYYVIDSFPEEQEYPMVMHLSETSDIDGDEKPEIISYGIEQGFAHTPTYDVFVSKLDSTNHFQQLANKITMQSITDIQVNNHKLILTGGLVGSVGAGEQQREYTDTYGLNNNKLVFLDRTYKESPYAYHRLEDGLLAEALGKENEAIKAYEDILKANQLVTHPERFFVEGHSNEESLELLSDAIQNYARLRLEIIYLNNNQYNKAKEIAEASKGTFTNIAHLLVDASSLTEGKAAIQKWANQNPLLIKVLNSPYGYANPKWETGTLTGNVYLPEITRLKNETF